MSGLEKKRWRERGGGNGGQIQKCNCAGDGWVLMPNEGPFQKKTRNKIFTDFF